MLPLAVLHFYTTGRDITTKSELNLSAIKSELSKAEKVYFSIADVKKSLRFSGFFLWQVILIPAAI